MAKIPKGTPPTSVGVAKGKFHGEEIVLQLSIWDYPQEIEKEDDGNA